MLKDFFDSNLPLILLFLLIGSLAIQQFLQEKLKPNEDYLEEIRNIGIIKNITKNIRIIKNEKIRKIIYYIFLLISYFAFDNFCEHLSTSDRFMLLIILVLTLLVYGAIDLKRSLDFLKTKNASDSTKKYLIYNFYFAILAFCLFIICSLLAQIH